MSQVSGESLGKQSKGEKYTISSANNCRFASKDHFSVALD
jgi:hypothetical protein